MKSSSAAVAAGGGGSSGKAAGGSNRRGSVGAGDNANNTNNTTNNQFAGTTTAIKTAIKTKNVISPDRFGLTDDFDFGGVGGDFEYDTVEERELKELERKLNDEVEEDLFEEPRRFNTLHRVIDVLGLQMIDDAATISGGLLPQKHSSNKNNNLDKNPAYRNLKAQQQIVEGAIEHMAVIHCADLNGSVIQVGRVARQFSDAVSKVRHLRKQVRDIQDTLGAAKDGTGGATTTTTLEGDKISSSGGGGGGGKTSRTQNAAAMSLRELWLKKLECEAVLGLLGRLDVIRAAPAHFDQLVSAPCRIGAAVLTLSRALSTMFSDDIAQVQALHKIMEQLLLRKQKAEEIVWDTVADVIYLRTGNGLLVQPQYRNTIHGQHQQTYSGHSVSSESKRSTAGRSHHSLHHVRTATASGTASVVSSSASLSGIVNPFMGNHKRSYGIQEEDGAANHDDDDDSVDSNHSGASLFSLEDVDTETDAGTKTVVSETSSFEANKRMMIPIPILEAELDLEADERRCLEEIALSGMAVSGRQRRTLPRYADPVLALRILVECLAQLGRLDDVERVISEGLNLELRQIVQQEQVRMFQRLEKKRGQVGSRSAARSENFKDFRRHLTGLLSSFGCVMVRLTHLAEVLRIRVVSFVFFGSNRE